jgi:hypothetical protein
MKNKLFQVIKNNFLSRKVIVFFACLFIASFSWLINVLNRNYTRIIKVNLEYTNIPEGINTSIPLPEKVQAEIKTSGTKLLFLLLKQKINKIRIDVEPLLKHKNKQVAFVQTLNAIGNLSQHLGTEVELIRIKPDTIFISFGKSYKRLIPVKANIELNYEKLFHLSEAVKITPGLIQISGDSALLESLDSLETEKIVLNQLNHNIEQEAIVIVPEKLNGRINLKNKSVKLLIQVDKYTEDEKEIPIKILNLPSGYHLRTFPDKIKIKYALPMGNFENIQDSDFVAEVNYLDVALHKEKLKVYVSTKKPFVKISAYSPEKIEYLLKK